jgi:hypothetical protein
MNKIVKQQKDVKDYTKGLLKSNFIFNQSLLLCEAAQELARIFKVGYTNCC